MLDAASVQHPSLVLATWTKAIQTSAMQQLLALADRPGIVSFALGLPDDELFPRDALAQAATSVLELERYALQYQPALTSLKRHIVHLMAQRNVSCTEEQVFLTAGAQQGMNLLAHLLLDTGGQVLTENQVYPGLQQVIAPFQPHHLIVPTDIEHGIDLNATRSLLASGMRPAFIYVMSEGHNPLGISMSSETRRGLIELARTYQVPIIEDDAYGFLYYSETPTQPLRAFDDQWVFYLGSFSKIIAPSLRVGWLIVPEDLMPKLAVIKEASDINTATFSQRIITAYLESGHLPQRLSLLRRVYRERRDAMLTALAQFFPRNARWSNPNSGMFVWVELPHGIDTSALLPIAIEQENVAYIPGQAFSVDSQAQASHCMRLNFSRTTPERITEGIARLAHALRRAYPDLD